MASIDTESEILALGERVTNDPTRNGFSIGDPQRTVTNMEMHAACVYRRDQVERAAEAGTCECEGGPYLGGQCRQVAGVRCPIWKQAVEIRKRMEKEDR